MTKRSREGDTRAEREAETDRHLHSRDVSHVPASEIALKRVIADMVLGDYVHVLKIVGCATEI